MSDPSSVQAVMNIGEGESIAGAWITPQIPDIGFYKLLAKKKKNGAFEWVHFIQRLNGEKDTFYRGEVASEQDLNAVVESINNALTRVFGNACLLKPGSPEMYSLTGRPLGNETIH
ncbi:MAG: hypothetical protein AB1728_01170 [Bacteroidota bacterium]